MATIPLADVEELAKRLSDIGVVEPTGFGLRRNLPGAACAGRSSWPPVPARAFAMLRLIGGPVGDDLRFDFVDAMWIGQAVRWLRDKHLVAGLGGVNASKWDLLARLRSADGLADPALCEALWALLAALRRSAQSTDGHLNGEHDLQFGTACGRLCPGLPNQHQGAGNLALARLRDAIFDALDADARPPAPSDIADIDKYFSALGELYERPLSKRHSRWIDAQNESAIRHWFAIRSSGSLPALARATLAVIGGQREHKWHWPGPKFVESAHALCRREHLVGKPELRTVLERHLRAKTHIHLVVHALGWLCHVRPQTEPPPPDDPAHAAVVRARGQDLFSSALAHVDGIARRWFDKIDPLQFEPVRYQPDGASKTPSLSKMQRAAFYTGMKQYPDALRAALLLRLVLAQIGFVVAGRHKTQRLYLLAPIQSAVAAAAKAPCHGPATQSIADAITQLWLLGGKLLSHDDASGHQHCFRPGAVDPLPSLPDIEKRFGKALDAGRIHRLAAWVLECLTSLVQLADENTPFEREVCRYVASAFAHEPGDMICSPDLLAVRGKNAKIFLELAQDNLQPRVRRRLHELGCTRPAGCPVCGQGAPR